ncbi:type II toxin-antitoxin system Phd/YefM family antitoxin [Qaidamihabitans albus]|uniref:type II toxin-antitoxin system Phd/YefM family antitoxin n=1 Tax=Qaidamihabitans albus TaxID=2795733 RepID=UPI0018F143A4|nr:type II toxin-antitoxin system prevent-host-death family antitoxin [Qaidamihabitans albus]
MTAETIGQRELRNDNAEIMRRVEAGESFTVTRHGRPVADLVPHRRTWHMPRYTLAEVRAEFGDLPPVDGARWRSERAEDDAVFGPDEPGDPWSRR